MLPIKKAILLPLILFITVLTCSGQDYYFKHYLVDDGLVHNTVVTLMQDSKGLLWIGTKGGLNRFDGYIFKSYKNEHNKFGTLGNNIIVSLAEDHKGMIWVGTERGVFRYDPYKEVFKEFPFLSSQGIYNILADEANNIWFLANGALYRYEQSKNKLTALDIHASCMALDSNKNLWLGTGDGAIIIYNIERKTRHFVQLIDKKMPSNFKLISKIYLTGTDDVLIGTTKQGLKSYNNKTGAVRSLLTRNKDNTEIYVRDIAAAGRNEYWIATESGIYVYNLKTNNSKNLKKRAGDGYSISDNAVYSLCRDNQGGLWAGTFFGGLNYYSSENARFEKFYPLPGINSISGNAVREICSDNKHNIWIGTEDAGISMFNPITSAFTNYTSEGKRTTLSYPNVHGLLAVDDKLYIGPFLHGLEIMDINTGRIIDRFKLIGEKGNMISDFVMSIYFTKDSTLLLGTIGTNAGLYSYDPRKKTFKKSSLLPFNTYVYAILEDHEGTIWTGSLERGAFYFNSKTGVKGNLRFAEKSHSRKSIDYQIQGIYEDSNNCIWFTTEGGGLIKLNADRRSFKKFTTEDGLPSNYLFRILEDAHKNLWISSLKGLICLNLKLETFKIYTQSNGLITDQFNYNSAFKDHRGKMYFGSVKGMIAFDPDKFNENRSPPPTYLTGFLVNNREVVPNAESSPLKRSITYTDTIILAHDQSNFSVEFAALDYSSPKVIRYKYCMKGLDKDWTYLNTNRKAYFTDLSPGDYTFVVSAESNVGIWTGKEKKLFIRILPPYWKSYTAYFFYLMIMVVILYLSIDYYHQYLEKKNKRRLLLFEHEKEKEIYEAKIEFFTNIAHEIQTPLTLIIGPVNLLMKKTEELPTVRKNMLMIEKNANRLLELTTQLLDFRKTEINQFGLNFVNTDITTLLREQVAGFQHQASKQSINLSTNFPQKHLVAFVDKEAFVKIFGNLISNAIKYCTSKAIISIENFNTHQEFTIRFSNDGKAIPTELKDKIFEPFYRIRGNEKPGTGIGLSLAKSLTELHNGRLVMLRSDDEITVFELTLPVHQKIEFNLSPWKKIKK